MLYKKNSSPQLDPALFQNPTREYRGTPFWSWNCQLTPDLLLRQIDYLKEMGFGGFHMHPRTGMATPYLSDEFMDLIKICVDKAKEEDMLAWLYDEDRWPSGSAGGIVTQNPAYRERRLLFTPWQQDESKLLLARYEVQLEKNGSLKHAQMLSPQEHGDTIWYAYVETPGPDPWFNNQTYVNTLDKKAIDEFIKVTYETYKNRIGDAFGDIVPAIFTDEPQFARKDLLGFAGDKRDVRLPWSDDLPETYQKMYGAELLPFLPELFWELPDGKVSVTRYRYHDHIAQRFAEAFADNCGSWCRENGIKLTGHMMEEPSLGSQTAALGEAMRSYRGFDLPGIDMLCDWREYTTAKQAQSTVHQYGYEGMLSELYGVTNWDFDFRGHKLQGDWQAALGVTVRVPHLSWVSMEGEAKRDYPASIFYQSSWYKEYGLIEDHFSRINTAMTRGKPVVRIGVIHPIESYWLHWGPEEQTHGLRAQMEDNFRNLTEWLLFSQLDFDFISESLLPSQCESGGVPFTVGNMQYDAIIVPNCETLRKTTVDRLEQFQTQGGHLIVLGNLPKYMDAIEAGPQLQFLQDAKLLSFEKFALLQELESVRELSIYCSNGIMAGHFLTQLRQDGNSRWLFIANGRLPDTKDLIRPGEYTIQIKGKWNVERYDTMTGTICGLDANCQNGTTTVKHTLFTQDSLLLHLTQDSISTEKRFVSPPVHQAEGFLSKVPVSLSEPNVLLLDLAEYAFDEEESYQPADEILRIDNKFRHKLGLPSRMASVAQPWVIPEEIPDHKVKLRFIIESEIALPAVCLALEAAENTRIQWNGQEVPSIPHGWYVDESIKKVSLPSLKAGTNTLELEAPFGKRTNLEWCYLLGEFGVEVAGFNKIITAPVKELAFGSITTQGLPFYGGNILYRLTVEGDGGDVTIQTPFYRGALIGVLLDGQRIGSIVFDPYSFTIPNLSRGSHEIGLMLFGNRINSFGAVHNCDQTCIWQGPDAWRFTGDRWSYEYNLKPMGILKSPAIIKAEK